MPDSPRKTRGPKNPRDLAAARRLLESHDRRRTYTQLEPSRSYEPLNVSERDLIRQLQPGDEVQFNDRPPLLMVSPTEGEFARPAPRPAPRAEVVRPQVPPGGTLPDSQMPTRVDVSGETRPLSERLETGRFQAQRAVERLLRRLGF